MIRTVIVDDELPAIAELEYQLKEYENIKIVDKFLDPIIAIDKIKQLKPDLVFLDIDMPNSNGIQTAKIIKSETNDIIIVFVTAYSNFALKAFEVYPIDYVMKPIVSSKLASTVKQIYKQYNFKKHITDSKNNVIDNPININCFGKFEVTKVNSSLRFSTQKSLELLQYIICNHGKTIYKDEILKAIFKTSDKKIGLNNFYVTLSRLKTSLFDFGIDNESIKINNDLSITINEGICDYIDFYNFIVNYPIIDERNIDKADKIIFTCSGIFLKDNDADWCFETREWVEVQLERLVLMASSYYRRVLDNNNAIKILQKYILKNAFSEQAYTTLMDIYIDTKCYSDFRIIFKQYENAMKEIEAEINDKYLMYYL